MKASIDEPQDRTFVKSGIQISALHQGTRATRNMFLVVEFLGGVQLVKGISHFAIAKGSLETYRL